MISSVIFSSSHFPANEILLKGVCVCVYYSELVARSYDSYILGIFFRFVFILLFMCVHVSLRICIQVPTEAREGFGFIGDRVTGNRESPDTGSGI